MEANEVLIRYKNGERDFRRVNLRGQSFQGQDLSGADFSEADIRGANFKNANLTGTNFCQAKAGLQKLWVTVLMLVSWIVSGLSGILSFLGGAVVAFIFDNLDNQVSSWIALVCVIIVYSVILRKGMGAGAVLGIVCVIGAVSTVAIDRGSFSSFACPIVIASIYAVAITSASARTSARVVSLFITSASASAIAFRLSGAVDIAVAIAVALVLVLLGAYQGWRALKGDPRDAWIRTTAIAFAATGGTSFYNADLTDADFTGATLKSTDLRKANLTGASLDNTSKIDLARRD
ncbi:pentapeptide repeat-containing protein [Moorena sp. SIO3H5]|uniref:pentapeptide repeat-containing protein n=1 Tax=Moorena sp. SIO3H5 TaxID=2607834 RepID=UPI0025DC6165|nr:pentapeptide repeat-containing protein [Moorena sp. SIO3H5]